MLFKLIFTPANRQQTKLIWSMLIRIKKSASYPTKMASVFYTGHFWPLKVREVRKMQ